MERKFALIVGNDQFEDPGLAGLVSPAAEARALAEVLEDPGIGSFDEVRALVNEPEAQVRRAIASLFARKQPDDLLLLYFSTHGLLDENGLLFLAARDTQRDLLDATSVEAALVTKVMNNSASRRQVLILDCCHSGAFARGIKGGAPGASVSTAAAFEGNGFGRWVLTATDSTQYAWDGDNVVGGNESPSSAFTHHLIEGLRTGAADEDDDGRISLDELYEYVYRRVLSTSPRQTPGKWSYKQQGNLVIARNPHPGRKTVSLPEHLQKALESDFPSTREGAVRDLERYLRGSQVGLAKLAEQTLEKVSTEDDSRKVQRIAAAVLENFHKTKEGYRERPVTQVEDRSAGATRTEMLTNELEIPKATEVGDTAEVDDSPEHSMETGPAPIGAPSDPVSGVEPAFPIHQGSPREVTPLLPMSEGLPDSQEASPLPNIPEEPLPTETSNQPNFIRSVFALMEAESITKLHRLLTYLIGLQIFFGSFLLFIPASIERNWVYTRHIFSYDIQFLIFLEFIALTLILFIFMLFSLPSSVMAYRLTRHLRSNAPIRWAICMFIPFINFFWLLALRSKVKAWCHRHGIQVGVLGPKKASIEELRRRLNAGQELCPEKPLPIETSNQPSPRSVFALMEAESISRLHRPLIYLIFLQIFFGSFLIFALTGLELEWHYPRALLPHDYFLGSTVLTLTSFIFLLLSLPSSAMAYQLTRHLRNNTSILWAIGMLIPLINLFGLLALGLKVKAWCHRHGIRNGFLGPERTSIEELRRRFNADQEPQGVDHSSLSTQLVTLSKEASVLIPSQEKTDPFYLPKILALILIIFVIIMIILSLALH